MSNKMKKKQIQQVQNQSQSGRSMVEMLGVLAIIAILSIGGIIGFRLAMNYYQANQIAHEMNIMRTDAQIKIAQGADKLTLGSPYDDKKINFNDYGTDFGCIYMEDENAEPSPAFCTGANAYYIELKEIPEGVCRPLANLIDNMDNEIAFYINDKSVDAEAEGDKGACNKDFNTLKVIFGADSDSEAIKCNDEGDPNCPAELPVCLNHVCVECEKDEDCLAKGTENPVCNSDTHTCEPCPPKSVFYEGECIPYECRSNEDCAAGEYCYLYEGCGCTEDTEFENGNPKCNGGTCKNAQNEAHPYELSDGYTYYFGNDMDWFSAKRFCDALHAEMITLETLGCSQFTHCNHITEQCRCDSQLIKEIYSAYSEVGKSTSSCYWLNSFDDECYYHSLCYGVSIGLVTRRHRGYEGDPNDGHNYDGALCRRKN